MNILNNFIFNPLWLTNICTLHAWAAAAVIGGAAISAGGSFLGADAAADAQAEATAANIAFQERKLADEKEQTAANIDRAFAGREEGFKQDLLTFLEKANELSPAGEAGANIQATLDLLDPSFTGAADALNTGVFSGGFFDRQLSNQEAVNAARTLGAENQVGAVDLATDEAIANLTARAANRGFTGASSFDLSNLARTRAKGRQDASAAISNADIANQLGIQNVNNVDINRILNSLTAADTLAANAAKRELLPVSTEANIQQAKNAPFSFLRINEPVSTIGNVNVSPDQFLGGAAAGGAAFQGLGRDLSRLGSGGFFDNRSSGGTATGSTTFNPVGGSGGINTQPINNPALLLPSNAGIGTGLTSPQNGSFFNN